MANKNMQHPQIDLIIQHECAKACDKSSHPALAIYQLNIEQIVLAELNNLTQ